MAEGVGHPGQATVVVCLNLALERAASPLDALDRDVYVLDHEIEMNRRPVPVVRSGGSLGEGIRRRSLGSAEEAGYPAELGIDALTYEELAAIGPAGFSQRVRNRVGEAPCFLSFDIDFVDPAYAPGTGTPEVGGPSSREALTYVRSLAGLDFRGFDCVEVSPPFDPAGQTAFVAANACFEMLSLLALRR